MGLIVVRETPAQAQALAVPGAIQTDMLEAAALVPTTPRRIDDPTTVARLKVRIDGLEALDPADLDGAGQSASGGTIEVRDARDLQPGPAPADLALFLRPEPFLESDAPEIIAEAQKAAGSPRTTAAASGAPRALRERDPGEEADGEPALGPRGAQDPHRGLQRAHRPLRRHGPLAGPARAHRGGSRVPPRGVLLPRVARGLGRGVARPGAVAPGGPHAQPVPRRRDPRAPHPRRPRAPGRDPGPRRPRAPRDHATSSCGPGRLPSSSARPRPTCVPWTCPCRDGTAAGGVAGLLPRGAANDPRREPGQDLRLLPGGGRGEPGGRPRRDPRLPGPERRGKDHDHPHDRRAAEADRRPRRDRRPRPRAGARGGEGRSRLHSRPAVPLREAHRRRVPALPRRPLRDGGRGGRGPRRASCSRSSSSWPGRTSSSRASPTA